MYKKIMSSKKLFSLCVFFMVMLLSIGSKITNFIGSISAQQTTDTVSLNETQKQLFSEAKKAAGDKNTFISLAMIGAVLLVVAFAMWLAFRNDGTEKKQTFARTPKKDF
jgi:putative exporter of polyketide antibiotics